MSFQFTMKSIRKKWGIWKGKDEGKYYSIDKKEKEN